MTAPQRPQWAADLAAVMREHGMRMAVLVMDDGQVHVLGARPEGGKVAADRLRSIAAQIERQP